MCDGILAYELPTYQEMQNVVNIFIEGGHKRLDNEMKPFQYAIA